MVKIYYSVIKKSSRETYCIILTLGGEIDPHHNITSRFHHQEKIQFRAPENVIDKTMGWSRTTDVAIIVIVFPDSNVNSIWLISICGIMALLILALGGVSCRYYFKQKKVCK